MPPRLPRALLAAPDIDLGNALPIVLPIVLLPSDGAALGSGGYNYSQTHNIGSALKAGALNAAGTAVGANVLGPMIGNAAPSLGSSTIGSTIGSALPKSISGAASSALGSLGGTSLSSALGGYVGSNIAGGFAPQGRGKQAGNYPYVPRQMAAAGGSQSINALSSLTPQQQSTGLATQGMYGGGLSPTDQSYYTNLINNQLVDSSGAVSPLSSLAPIQTSYLDKLGFGGYSDSNSLLEALSKWKPQTA